MTTKYFEGSWALEASQKLLEYLLAECPGTHGAGVW